MALIVAVKIGDVVDIADRWVAVLSFDARRGATLICDDGEKISVSADGLTTMTPEVLIGLASEPARSRLRLMFEAPRHVPITRRYPRGESGLNA